MGMMDSIKGKQSDTGDDAMQRMHMLETQEMDGSISDEGRTELQMLRDRMGTRGSE